MTTDMIRCPGCGVKMDLSTFEVRPSQVICPRCQTRSLVPPKLDEQPVSLIQPNTSEGNQSFSNQPSQASDASTNQANQNAAQAIPTQQTLDQAHYQSTQQNQVNQQNLSNQQPQISNQSNQFQATEQSPANESFVQPAQANASQVSVSSTPAEQMQGSALPASMQTQGESLSASQPKTSDVQSATQNNQISEPQNSALATNAANVASVSSTDVALNQNAVSTQSSNSNSALDSRVPQVQSTSLNLGTPTLGFPQSPVMQTTVFSGSLTSTPASIITPPSYSMAAPSFSPAPVLNSQPNTMSSSATQPGRDEALASLEVPLETSSFFDTEEESAPSKPEVLPIDRRGNTEPLAFSILGIIAVITLFPPIGLALCIAALMMSAEERRHGLYNAHGGLAKAVSIIGILINCALLIAEIALVIMAASDPAATLGYFI